MDDPLSALRTISKVHAQIDPDTGHRHPLIYLTGPGAGFRGHIEAPSAEMPDVDQALLDDMRDTGWIDIDYGTSSYKVRPTPLGEAMCEATERCEIARDSSPPKDVLAAIADQFESESRMSWTSVRPVLAALRAKWEADGFSYNGLAAAPIWVSLPEEQRSLFSETLRRLEAGGYIENQLPALTSHEAPAEFSFTERTMQTLDGWPGATSDQLAENLIAVVNSLAASEGDSDERSKLESFGEAAKDVGVEVLSELLAKTVLGV